jgi:signal transduction histidine kinase
MYTIGGRSCMTASGNEDLILDILIHDINNANTIAMGYATILESRLTGEDLGYLKSLAGGVKQSVELIRNAQAIRRVQKTPAQLVRVNLGNAVRRVPAGFPGAGIEVGGTAGDVSADDFLDEVFRVVVGNAVKYGGRDVRIRISLRETGDRYEVSVEDTGPGIPDALKEGIFNRLIRDAPKKSRKGLGFVLARLIVERYGGIIRADDRVPGKPEQGAAIRLTIPKYQG